MNSDGFSLLLCHGSIAQLLGGLQPPEMPALFPVERRLFNLVWTLVPMQLPLSRLRERDCAPFSFRLTASGLQGMKMVIFLFLCLLIQAFFPGESVVTCWVSER